MGRLRELGLLTIVMACAGAPGLAAASDHAVTFPSGAAPAAYSPSDVDAVANDTVTFSGAFASHPLVWTDADFATQSSGTVNSYTFTRPGLYRFHCQIHDTMTGSVRVAGDALATPDFTWSPSAPKTGQVVTFTPTGFADPDGTIARYEWDVNGDGTFETTGAAPTKTYTSVGTVSVALRYVDDGHETSAATVHQVTVTLGAGSGTGGTGGGTGAGGTGTLPPAQGGDNGAAASPGSGSGGASSGAGDRNAATGVGGDQQGAAAQRIRIGAQALTFRARRAGVAVTLRVAGKARVTLRRGKVTLATGTTSLRAGAGMVRLRLTAAGARALRRVHGSMRVTLTVAVKPKGAGSTATAHRTVTVRVRP
jgi:plastocyanin